jgi:transposase-like protein
MSAKKLSDADKAEILEQYRQPGETTSTLAKRYRVSNSTISRLLKSSFSPEEYERLIQQKRATRGGGSRRRSQREKPTLKEKDTSKSSKPAPTPEPTPASEQLTLEVEADTPNRRRRKRSSTRSDRKAAPTPKSDRQETPTPTKSDRQETPTPTKSDRQPSTPEPEVTRSEADSGETTSERRRPVPKPVPAQESVDVAGAMLEILPLTEASLPKTCYLVVDRASELIARPLKEFDDLGQIPAHETGAKTLPVFDNHRVARRFANRSQRAIKVPDSQMLQKTGSYLQAKGITRIFFDGQVYSL